MRFAMFSDLHYDAIPDGDRRIGELVNCAQVAEAEFIVELGDLCYPISENNKVLAELRNSGLPCYFTMGNHNTDQFETQEVLEFFGLEKSYYVFLKENIKFIVLDANFMKKKESVLPYHKGNYDRATDVYPYIPDEEIEWLKKELEDDEKYYVIISHQSLANDFPKRGISNREQVRSLLEARNLRENKILFCINGHDHGGDYKVINGISYYTLNSCAYIWHGIQDVRSYSAEIHKQYPYLKDLILYQEALHTIVEIDEAMNVRIEGTRGNYQKHSPGDIGLSDTWNGVWIEAKTLSVAIKRDRAM